MDFFKDPKYKSIRIVLILVIIIGAGWFTYSNMNQSDSNQGRVINQTPTTVSKDTIKTISYYDTELGKNVKVSQAIIPGGGGGTINSAMTCTSSCTGNNCTIQGCDPNSLSGSCTACVCGGNYTCSYCTCSKSVSEQTGQKTTD